MGGGSGVMLHAVRTLRNNRKLLRIKNRFKKERSFLNLRDMDLGTPRNGIQVEKISSKTLKNIGRKVRSEARSYNLRFACFLMLTLPILIYGCYFLFHNYTIVPYTEKEIPDLTEKYYFFIEDGDRWLKNQKYHNAIFQYKMALSLFPSEFDAQYRLTLAYAYRCEYTFLDCDKGKTALMKLRKQYPNKSELIELKLILYGSIK